MGVVTLLWNHPVLTGMLLLVFTPPFFPLVVYFSPLLMSTALCVVALVSVGSQMEKIKAEGGPGQLESHLGRERGVSRWAPERHHYSHRSLFSDNPSPAPPSWTGPAQFPPEPEVEPPSTPPAEDSEEDWWDSWVKEYEARPGWGEQEDHTTRAPLPQAPPANPAPAPDRRQDAPPPTPRKPEPREKNPPPAPIAVPASVAVVSRQEASRSLPRSRQEEVVVAVADSELRPHVSLAPIRTGRETPAAERHEAPPPRSMDVERVSDVQALQSIEKLLRVEMGGSTAPPPPPPTSLPRSIAGVGMREAASPQWKGGEGGASTGKGIAVEASEKNRNKIAAPDVGDSGDTPLLRYLKTSQSRGAAYAPLPVRASKGLMSEKVLPPPQFSPRLLQSLQPLPPKGLSPRLPNPSVPLGNPMEKVPHWVYDGIPRERAESQDVNRTETAEEKHIREFEQAVRELSEKRRRKAVRQPAPVQATSPARRGASAPSTPSLTPAEATLARIRRERTPAQTPSKASPRRLASRDISLRTAPPATSVDAAIAASRTSEDAAAGRGHGAGLESSSLDSTPATAPAPRASAAMVAASPRRASRAASPEPAPTSASPRPASPRPASPRPASPRPASPRPASPRPASPRPASGGSSPQKASSVAASPRRASPHRPSIAASAPWPAASPQKPASSASLAASPRPPLRVALPPHDRSSVPSSPSSIAHPRRRRQSSKHCTDKVAFTRIDASAYYDPPSAAEKEKLPCEDYVPIEEEVAAMPIAEAKDDEAQPEDESAQRWGRSFSATARKSRRRLEPMRVVTSADTDRFSLKKSFSTRSGETKKFVDSSSSDDEREPVTPRACRRSLGRTTKPLVWRSRSVQARDDSDD